MNIYLLKPSAHWHYCGGGAAVLAETFADAKALFLHYPGAGPVDDVLTQEPEALASPDASVWVLVQVFPLAGAYEAHVVFADLNYA